MTGGLSIEERRMFDEFDTAIERAACLHAEVLAAEEQILALEKLDPDAAAVRVEEMGQRATAAMESVSAKLEPIALQFLNQARRPGESALDFQERIKSIVFAIDPSEAVRAITRLRAFALNSKHTGGPA